MPARGILAKLVSSAACGAVSPRKRLGLLLREEVAPESPETGAKRAAANRSDWLGAMAGDETRRSIQIWSGSFGRIMIELPVCGCGLPTPAILVCHVVLTRDPTIDKEHVAGKLDGGPLPSNTQEFGVGRSPLAEDTSQRKVIPQEDMLPPLPPERALTRCLAAINTASPSLQ